MSLNEKYFQTLNRLAKWRTVFAGWQLGTRSSEDPECQAVRDHRETTIVLRAEVNALTELLVQRGIFTRNDFMQANINECEMLNRDYENRFPGFRATDIGIDIDVQKAAKTMKNWKP